MQKTLLAGMRMAGIIWRGATGSRCRRFPGAAVLPGLLLFFGCAGHGCDGALGNSAKHPVAPGI